MRLAAERKISRATDWQVISIRQKLSSLTRNNRAGLDTRHVASHLELPERDAGGNEQRPAAHLPSVREFQHAARTFDPNPADLLRCEDLHPKAPRLGDSTPGEIVSTKAHRKTEVVFNAGTPPGLSAGSFPFHEQCVQTIGGAIYRRCQACRTSADDDQIVEGKLRLGFQTQLLGNLTGGRIAQERTVRKKDDGQRRDIISSCGEKLFRSLVCLDV